MGGVVGRWDEDWEGFVRLFHFQRCLKKVHLFLLQTNKKNDCKMIMRVYWSLVVMYKIRLYYIIFFLWFHYHILGCQE